MGFGETAYTGVAELGKFQAMLSLVIGIIIAVCLIIVAIFIFRQNQDHLIDVSAKIIDTECTPYTKTIKKGKITETNTSYKCVLTVNYIANNKEYNRTLITNSTTEYIKGDTIDITYDKTNPNQIQLKIFRYKYIASGSCSCAIIILLLHPFHDSFGIFSYSA